MPEIGPESESRIKLNPSRAIIVPARLASVRFPRKLLFPLSGKALILWTAERLRSEVPEIPLHFAVDGEELAELLSANGFEVILTPPELPSGTDRVAWANQSLRAEWVVNVQADEPMVEGVQVRLLFDLLEGGGSMATLATPFQSRTDFLSPHQVKVVLDDQGRALYFSRAPVPFERDCKIDDDWVLENQPLRHLGLYGYRREFLEAFSQLKPGRLEKTERLEQLRALENGYEVRVGLTEAPLPGIDTPEDATRMLELLGA